MTTGRTRTKKAYTNDTQTAALKEMFDPWIGELPNVREVTFKPNMDSWTVFVLYDEVVEGEDWDEGY
jgi:hypothetical protein